MRRGEIRWAELPEPRGSEPGFRRPVLVVQDDVYNESRLGTVLCLILTSNTHPGGHAGQHPAPRR